MLCTAWCCTVLLNSNFKRVSGGNGAACGQTTICRSPFLCNTCNYVGRCGCDSASVPAQEAKPQNGAYQISCTLPCCCPYTPIYATSGVCKRFIINATNGVPSFPLQSLHHHLQEMKFSHVNSGFWLGGLDSLVKSLPAEKTQIAFEHRGQHWPVVSPAAAGVGWRQGMATV